MSLFGLVESFSSTGKISGWPWTEQDVSPEVEWADRSSWPKISIVIPSYNQGHFIEETIRSILFQKYPNLELIIIDGGSKDKTVEVIKKYEQWISYWVSEKDDGQTHAINKGFSTATGEIVSWVNSDDMLLPGALFESASVLFQEPNVQLVYGNSLLITESGVRLPTLKMECFTLEKLLHEQQRHLIFHVPFIRRCVLEEIGFLDEQLNFAMDYEFSCRIARAGMTVKCIDRDISYFRVHSLSKTCNVSSGKEYYREAGEVCRQYGGAQWNWMYRTYYRICIRNKVEVSRFSFVLNAYRKVKPLISFHPLTWSQQ